MAELPAIQSYILESHPDSRTDAYRWRVWLEESVPLWVELSGPQANETHLALPVLEQVAGWDGPVELAVEHFTTG